MLQVFGLIFALVASAPAPPAAPTNFASDDEFLEHVQHASFKYFWHEVNTANGLVRDRSNAGSHCSIAAVGFGLTALGIGADHGWVTRAQARDRALLTLRTFLDLRQGSEPANVSGYKGWFYHFLDMRTGERVWKCELSSIDTILLLAGALYASEYFKDPEITAAANTLFNRLDWQWMLNGGRTLTMGWHPETGFIAARWKGYNEASILYLMGLGAEHQPLQPDAWHAWTETYQWKTSYGYSFIHFPPLFGHQYSACWIDFRDIADDFTAAKGITYFENSRRATLAQREYCIENPGRFAGYGPNVWGLTACDGPGRGGIHGYRSRGAPPAENDDGTIAPTAAGSSIPFAPAECIRALRHMYDTYSEQIWCAYGFRDAFNLQHNWWDPDVLGIDQGAMLIMIENYRTGKVWEVMRNNSILERGLKRAGFRSASPK